MVLLTIPLFLLSHLKKGNRRHCKGRKGVVMPKLNARGMKWLKGFHLFAVSCWIGGGVALFMLYFLKVGALDGGVLYGMNQAYHHVDIWVVIIPGAFGCLLTGLFYGIFTNWGFFKHKWILVKWVLTISAILSGTFLLGPWEERMLAISREMGLLALGDPAYMASEKNLLILGTSQTVCLILAIFLSVFKPWKKRSK